MSDDQKISRGRPRKASAKRDADRSALISAAFDIVREGGSSALTARSLSVRVGVAVGSVYTAFADLDALRLELNAVTMGLLKDHLALALSRCPGDSVEARLLCLAQGYTDFAALHRPIWSALFEARVAPAPPAVAAHIAELFALLEGVLGDADRLEPREVPLLARALWSSLHGAVYLAGAGGLGPIGPAEVPAMIAALVRAVVAGSATAS